MAYRYAIQGMVCHRCDLALAEVAAATGGDVISTGRGYADFAEPLSQAQERLFVRELEAIRFSIIRTEEEETAEAVEHALQSLVRTQLQISSARDLHKALMPLLGHTMGRAAAHYRALRGQTPLERFTRLRMEWATERLQEGKMQVSEVGYALGYRHLSGFSRAFKRVMGVNPASVEVGDEVTETL